MRECRMKQWGEYFVLFVKGVAMGIGNIIPGVSGGTIALITGIYERFIHAFKSWDVRALRLLLKGDLKGLYTYTDLGFITSVMLGAILSILLLAKVLNYTLDNYPVYTWAYFFGLILASVYFVGKTIERWNFGALFALTMGVLIALVISFLSPTSVNRNFWYLIVCGVVAICSMLLPGLSGSFVLILMGNYKLVLEAIETMDFSVLVPVALGTVIGLVSFSRFLSWLIRKYRNATIALLTGFVVGSLSMLWPWQEKVQRTDAAGMLLVKPDGEPILFHQRYLPDRFDQEVVIALLLMLLGVITIWGLERLALKRHNKENAHA